MNIEILSKYFQISESSPSGLIWLIDNVDGNNRINAFAGDCAGNLSANGYWKICLKSTDYYVHRIVFLLHNGFIDDRLIDHINRIRSDNNPCNLRLVENFENSLNNSFKPGKTGVKGVNFTASGNIISSWHVKGVRGWSESFNVEELGLAEAINRAKHIRDTAIAKATNK